MSPSWFDIGLMAVIAFVVWTILAMLVLGHA